ncbi:PAS domain-containing hybrid sensor histidine kinase/response regulator [Zhongshania aliphaticivorans]|uniref:PAS domain-containing hybrid sensor histidine kinase/response regulator n=1 Tax=Zhongshania aliphaticivorans TaxID=1470434 RepID=UPI0012E6991F|nr:ATP-binding protein [Zhongshania aliphaticivorans]CAA0081641.1 Autoinducer 2 sensor kinase/phosphatase LuxQ [Zhongshania aliphaticivorans]
MHDWIESRESKRSAVTHRAVLNTVLAGLCVLLLALASSQIFLLNRVDSVNTLSEVNLAQFQARESALYDLDEALARGSIIHEFASAYLVNDLAQVDIIRSRLMAARAVLMGDVSRLFPQTTIQDLVRLLSLYLSYQPNSIEHLVEVPVPLNPKADSQELIHGLNVLNAYQREQGLSLAISAVDQQTGLHHQNLFVLILSLICLIPLLVGVSVSRKLASEHRDKLTTRDYINRLINSLPGVVLLTDSGGKIISASQSTAEFLQYSRDQLSGMDMSSLLPKRFRQQYQLFSKNYLDSDRGRGEHQVKGRELLVLNAEGVEVPVELYFGDFETHDGDVLVVCLHDVTERRYLYQQYQHSQRRFEMAMMASRDGLWDWDMTTDSVFFSPAWLQMIGIQGGQPLDGRVVFNDSIHPDDRERVKAAIDIFIKSDELVFRDEHRLRRRNGSVCDAVCRACAQRDSTGQVVRIVGMHSDVTHFKEAEREVRRLNRNLEDRVRLRTQQLETALLQAEGANRAKATFLAVMGHEIRTPMNGVIGMTDLLSKTELSREQWMMVDTVRRSSMSLLGTLDNILDYSALDAADLELQAESIQLAEFVEGVADEFAERAAKNKLQFILHIAPNLPAVVFADATRLRKILFNLLDNAMKFSHSVAGDGVVQLRVGAEEKAAEPRQRIVFEVIDNGIGVSGEMRKQLFKPFMLEENSRARRFGGTGLGLAITTRLLGLMGGEIVLDEEYNQGSRFVCTIPFTVDSTSKRISAGADVTVLAYAAEGLLKESLQAALALNGQVAHWIATENDLSAVLSTSNTKKAVLILAGNADKGVLNYCKKHNVRVIAITPRPIRISSEDSNKVYSNPLLPSALYRAVEYQQRLSL